MSYPEKEIVNSKAENTEKPVGDTEEMEERKEKGLPDVNAENLDDAGDIEGLQLGLATAKPVNNLDNNKGNQDED